MLLRDRIQKLTYDCEICFHTHPVKFQLLLSLKLKYQTFCKHVRGVRSIIHDQEPGFQVTREYMQGNITTYYCKFSVFHWEVDFNSPTQFQKSHVRD